MKLRQALQNDKDFVDSLTRVVMMPYVTQQWKNQIDIEKYFSLNEFDLPNTKIIQYNNEDIGRLTVVYSKDNIKIDNIHILPNYQGKGIGRKLIEDLIAEANDLNLPLALQVLEVNPAQKLYKALGFEIYDTKEHRYFMRKFPSN